MWGPGEGWALGLSQRNEGSGRVQASARVSRTVLQSRYCSRRLLSELLLALSLILFLSQDLK
jgi:hypothetical protein